MVKTFDELVTETDPQNLAWNHNNRQPENSTTSNHPVAPQARGEVKVEEFVTNKTQE